MFHNLKYNLKVKYYIKQIILLKLHWIFQSSTLPVFHITSCIHFSRIQPFVTPWTAACQAPLFMEFFRQEYWVSCHFLLQRILPTQGWNLHLLQWQEDSLPVSHFRGSVQFSFSVVSWLFATSWTAAPQASLDITDSQSLLKLMSIESVMLSNHLISVVPFSSHLQSFPASGSFPVSQFFTSGGQSIGVSASALVLLMKIQDWFPLGLTGLISLQSKGLSESSPIPQFKSINSLVLSFLYGPALTSVHDHWKNHSFWLDRPLLAKSVF